MLLACIYAFASRVMDRLKPIDMRMSEKPLSKSVRKLAAAADMRLVFLAAPAISTEILMHASALFSGTSIEMQETCSVVVLKLQCHGLCAWHWTRMNLANMGAAGVAVRPSCQSVLGHVHAPPEFSVWSGSR
jgi:hypothetical protein